MSALSDELIWQLKLEVVEQIELSAASERLLAIPQRIVTGPLGPILREMYPDLQLRRHQSLALHDLSNGHNCVVATGTASGKTLIFQLYALHLIKKNVNARVIVYYPLKALASDQFERWKQMCERFGLPANTVARIDGEVLAPERDAALNKSKIILMTPDVCQAWFMQNVGSSAVRTFLANLALLILDEAHVYESVFGSNVAFLLRRLISAKRHVARASGEEVDLQIVAATATIAEPAAHLENLTGKQFECVSEEQNGAPQHPRTLLHVPGAEYGAAGELGLSSVISGLNVLSTRRRFIAFINSRQGTERVARGIGSTTILP